MIGRGLVILNMSNIAIFKPNQTPEYLRSVNTPEYTSDPDVLVDPDIRAVAQVPLKHWKRTGDTIVEMSDGEKATLASLELATRKALADDYNIESTKIVLTALIKVINQRLSSGQKITKQEMIDALKGEIA